MATKLQRLPVFLTAANAGLLAFSLTRPHATAATNDGAGRVIRP